MPRNVRRRRGSLPRPTYGALVTTVVLVPGGLWDDMDAAEFWDQPGVTSALRDQGFDVQAVDRLPRAPSWRAESAWLDAALPRDRAYDVVAGSNGCSAAVRLAIDYPARVGRIVLCWPATPRRHRVEGPLSLELEAAHGAAAADTLPGGDTLRGIADDELRNLSVPVAVVPPDPENYFHEQATVDALLTLAPNARGLPGSTEPPRPDFPEHLDRFVDILVDEIRNGG